MPVATPASTRADPWDIPVKCGWLGTLPREEYTVSERSEDQPLGARKMAQRLRVFAALAEA